MAFKLGDIFVKLGLQKDEFDKGLDGAKKKTVGFGSSIKDMSALAVSAWAAVGAGAIMAFNAIKNSSDTLSTRWDIMMGGMTAATNEFWRTLAIGDWSNFITNMSEAVRVGREYVAMLDDIEEGARALSVQEAKKLKENTQLEIDAANASLSNEARKAAAEKRIKNEEEIAATRIALAKKVYENEKMITIQQTRLNDDQVENILADFNSIDKQKAKAYNEIFYSAKKGGFTDEEIERNLVFNKGITQTTKDYAKALRQMGDTTDEQLNKMVDAFFKLQQAEESVLSNTRRVRQRLGSLTEENGKSEHNTAVKQLADLKAINDELEAQRILTQNKNRGGAMSEITPIGTPSSIANEPIEFSAVFGNLDSSYEFTKNKFNKFTEEFNADALQFTEELNSIIQSGMINAIESFASGLTELAMGEISGKEFGAQVLAMVGNFMIQLGTAFIVFSKLFIAFKASIAKMDGVTALGIGIALVAAGAAISTVAKKGMSGGGASASAASGYKPSASSSAVSALNGNVVFELQGTTLRGVLNNQDRKNSLIR